MLPINTVRTGTDGFSFSKKLLMIRNTPLDCSASTEVNGVTLSGTQPSGTDRRLAFKVDGTWYRLTGTGTVTLTALATQTLTADSLLSEGNTVAEIATATSISGFVGKQVYVAFALYAPGDATSFPTLKINGIVEKSNQDTYVKVVESQEYPLSVSGTGSITDIQLDTTVSDGGSVVVQASLKQNGTWSDYMALSAAKNNPATAVKFKATYTSTTIGTSLAKVNSLVIFAKEDDSLVVGTTASIYTATQDFGTGMLYARILVKHQELKDARLKAYAHFGSTTKKRDKLQIGTGTGGTQTITLSDAGIDFSTFQLFFDLAPNFTFDYSSALNTVTFTAPADANIFASYDYGLEAESWQEMTKGNTQKYADSGLYSTDFTFEVAAGTAKGVSAIQVALEKPPGSVTNKQFGTGSGKTQYFVLDHYARLNTLQITASDIPVDRSTWNYDPVSKILTIVAAKDAPLKYSYVWDAEVPVVTGIIACWNE